MDKERFDDLTRSLTAIGSRRGALRLLAGAATGALAGRVRLAAAGERTGPRCGRGQVECRGECMRACPDGKVRSRDNCECICARRRCPDVKTQNPRTCRCECPGDMKDCGRTCVGQDRCCPGERQCSSGGCVPQGACCHDEMECDDGSCRPLEGPECCPEHRMCTNGDCVPRGGGSCCNDERLCPDGSCAGEGACCPGVEETCPSDSRGCCVPGEACSDDGCCPLVGGNDVCGGKCVNTNSDKNNCGRCGVQCPRCQTCENGVCRTPNQATCETCVNGEVTPGVPCGGHCCRAGAECCGGGCCEPGKCRVQNGQTCCSKVVENRPICLRM